MPEGLQILPTVADFIGQCAMYISRAQKRDLLAFESLSEWWCGYPKDDDRYMCRGTFSDSTFLIMRFDEDFYQIKEWRGL